MKFKPSAVIINVRDTERSEPFYRDTLGMRVEAKRPAYLEAELAGMTFLIESENPGRAAGFEGMRIGVRTGVVFSVGNVREAAEWLRGQGAVIVVEPVEQPWGVNAVFADPDGNEFILEEAA